MRIVEGEPDHPGLGAWAQALQRLLRRWQRPPATVILSVIARRPRPSHQTEKKLQGRNVLVRIDGAWAGDSTRRNAAQPSPGNRYARVRRQAQG